MFIVCKLFCCQIKLYFSSSSQVQIVFHWHEAYIVVCTTYCIQFVFIYKREGGVHSAGSELTLTTFLTYSPAVVWQTRGALLDLHTSVRSLGLGQCCYEGPRGMSPLDININTTTLHADFVFASTDNGPFWTFLLHKHSELIWTGPLIHIPRSVINDVITKSVCWAQSIMVYQHGRNQHVEPVPNVCSVLSCIRKK